MSILMVLKIFSDCCIGFAILASGPVSFGIPPLLPALLWGIIAGFATFFEEKGWKMLRYLCGVLPLLCLMLGEGSGQMLILAVPAIYTTLVIFRGKLELEYYSYNRFFLQSLWLLGGAYLIVLVWEFLSAITGKTVMLLDVGIMFKYALVHIVCGIMLQRQLRLGVDQISKSGRRQLSAVLGAGGGIAFGFLVAEPMLRTQVLGFVKIALLALGVPVMVVVELFSKFIELFSKLQENNAQTPTGEGGAAQPGLGGVMPPNATGPVQPDETVAKELDPVLVWGLLVGVLLLVAAVILYKSFQKGRNVIAVEEMTGFVVTPPKKKQSQRMSNRHKVRQLYRDFLRTENGHGLKLKKSDTSADVLRRIHPETDKKSAADLRQVYLSARYDDRQNVSKSQVYAAKQALKGTKKTGKS